MNVVEYPAAPLGQAVIRFSLMPEHTQDQLDKLAKAFDFSFKNANQIYSKKSGIQSCPSAKL